MCDKFIRRGSLVGLRRFVANALRVRLQVSLDIEIREEIRKQAGFEGHQGCHQRRELTIVKDRH